VGIERFQRICFSNESKLCPEKAGHCHVRLRKGEDLPTKYFRPRVMFHGGLEIMVWGMISCMGDRVLIRLDMTLDGEGYLQLLKKKPGGEAFWITV